MTVMAPPTISDYGLIGDSRTAALVSAVGSIDWMCVPRFDASPLFSRLIDESGGSFSLRFQDVIETRRSYLDGSPVIGTQVATSRGTARVLEGMVANVRGGLTPQSMLVRWVECQSGGVDVTLLFDPLWGLPGRRPDRIRRAPGQTMCEWNSLAVSISCEPELVIEPGIPTSVRLKEGESLTLVMGVADRCPVTWVPPDKARLLLLDTQGWWKEWSDAIDYDGPGRDAIVRSLITLRLLTYSPSGAPVAAPTTSLPESIGAGRNWDYRYAWPRDASIGLVAFSATGNYDLAHSFMNWLLHSSRLTRPRLRVLYDLYGRPARGETEVDVSGYRGSRPVRVGNDARDQHQLDVYGWVAESAWGLEQAGHRVHGEMWRALAGFADFVSDSWREPDAGIWEVRGETAQYVHSKLMAWLALDRISRMAASHSIRQARAKRWELERDAVRSWIRSNGVDRNRNTLVWKAGSDELDAALLILPVVGFEPEGSPLVAGTVAAIREDLEIGEGLILRYRRGKDGLEGDEGVFLPCSFWLVQALASIGKKEEAAALFESLLARGGDLGLFAEELDPNTGEQLGNFPQAFTHATIVQAGLALCNATSGETKAT